MNLFTQFTQSYTENEIMRVFLETPGGERYTYQDMFKETAQIANFLVHKLELNKGDRVIAQLEKSPQTIFLYLACLRAGLVYVPLNPAFTSDEVNYFVDNAKPSLIVTFTNNQNKFEAHGDVLLVCLEINKQGDFYHAYQNQQTFFEDVSTDDDDTAVMLYTSGTTGKPKGAMITHKNLYVNAVVLTDYWAFNENDILLHALPIFHVHGLFFALHTVLLSKAKLFFIPKFAVETIVQYLPTATVLMGVPTFYTRLLESDIFNAKVCRNMRLFISGSAPMLSDTHKKFEQVAGMRILERYGMTETGINTSNPYDDERRVGTVGFALPGSELRVVDKENQPVESGKIGHIQVRGDNVFKGYWQNPEKTASEFTADNYFKTGDLGVMDNDGYLTIVGRSKDLIISGGMNIYPKEVETCIDILDEIKESAVIGLPHNDLGEAVAAVVVKSLEISEEDLIAHAKKQLAGYKVPKKIFFANELPRNTMGKVQKNKLRELYAE